MKSFLSLVGFCALVLANAARAQDHGHLFVGAVAKTPGSALAITNAPDLNTASRFVKTLVFAPTNSASAYRGYFNGNITFEALAATNQLGFEVDGGAAPGAWIHAQILSVEGPAGGAFGFWETTNGPAFSIPCGSTSTNIWIVSSNGGAPGTDPFGHIHGRRFTATTAGIYTVRFRALDLSTNGPGGGPIHAPSEVVSVFFQAGVNVAPLSRNGVTNRITIGTVANQTFYLEASDDLATTNWTEIGTVAGTDRFESVEETVTGAGRFYRVRVTTP
jgi:hypothetical protein